MNKNFTLLLSAAAVVLATTFVSAQPIPGNGRYDNRNEDRWDDRHYENNRNGSSRYDNNWMTLSHTRVSLRGNQERITLNRRMGDIQQLLFSSNGAVNIYRVAVRFSNGRTQELQVRNNRWDSRSNRRWEDELIVNIPGNRYADVRQVMFWYDADHYSRTRPVITLLGR